MRDSNTSEPIKHLKVVRFSGGLGNQLCKYAFFRAVQESNPQATCCAEFTQYDIEQMWNGVELESIFGIRIPNLLDYIGEKEREECLKKVGKWSQLPPEDGVKKLRDYLPRMLRAQRPQLKIVGQYLGGMTSAGKALNKNKAVLMVKKIIRPYRKLFDACVRLMLHSVRYDLIIQPELCKEDEFRHFILTYPGDVYYYGFWEESDYWFYPIGDKLRQELKFPALSGEENLQVAQEMERTNSVSIHVRRGDMLYANQDLFTFNHYYKSVQHIRQNVESPVFFLFSNNIDWCRENFEELGLSLQDKIYYIGWNSGENAYKDMQLMTLCKHNITSNSTFSWWGAWLNSNHNRIVCVPNGTATDDFAHMIVNETSAKLPNHME